MNLDRLLKLLKLANHNPNDSEANSAARAASRMLGEENYKWLENAKRNGGRPLHSEPSIREDYDPRTDETVIRISRASQIDNPKIVQLLKQLQAEIHRQREPPRPRRGPEGFGFDWGESTGFDWEKEFWKRYQKDKKEAHSYDYETRGGFYGPEWDIPYDKPPKKPPPKREPVNWTWTQQEEEGGHVRYRKVYKQSLRDCTKCGHTQLTSDDTTPFVCYNCRKKG